MVRMRSTNRGAEPVSFSEALFRGLASDKGLYTPEKIPRFSKKEMASMSGKGYHEIAYEVVRKYAEKGEIGDDALRKISRDAYDFEVPLERYGEEGNTYIMRLDRGPTCSFKDFAARMMARLMQYHLKGKKRKLAILVATSGDTGSAVASAFHGLDNIKIFVLFPQGKVTELQRKQMTTLGKNVVPIEVKGGNFDDCQKLVKTAFTDKGLKEMLPTQYSLSSANSINIGRLVPQAAYYFWAYSRLAKKGEKIVFSVPSGNFGNITAALMAKLMGLPVHRLVAAVNANDVFPRLVRTGKYAPQSAKPTLSNAMDVSRPSNVPRIFDLLGGQMDEQGNIIEVPREKLGKTFHSESVTDGETRAEIREAYKKYGIVLEPHGAVGSVGLKKYLKKDKKAAKLTSVFVETADPAKFPQVVREETGVEPKNKVLEGIKEKKEEYHVLPADYEEFKRFLLEHL